MPVNCLRRLFMLTTQLYATTSDVKKNRTELYLSLYKQKLMEFKAFQGISWPNSTIFKALSQTRSRELLQKP